MPTTANSDETDNRQPELPWLDAIDPDEVGYLINPMADAMTTAADAAEGRCWSRFGASRSSRATAIAPTTPVNCVRAPAASATGVRDELLLIGKP